MSQRRSVISARSENIEVEIDATESEIAKLQRQLKIMERDRQSYNFQAQEQIRKQQQEIEKLLKEQEELHRNLGTCKRLSQQQLEDTENLQVLLKQGDVVEEELENERQTQKQLQKEISSLKLKLTELRQRETSSRDSQRSEVWRTQKAIRTLEYKLDRANTSFSEQLTKNNYLKEELQTFHIERARFQQLHNRLNKELQEVRKQIEEVINMSTASYDARVETQSKMNMMKEKAVKDLMQYNSEMKELERIIAHEFDLNEFMSIKCCKRTGQGSDHELAPTQSYDLREQKVDSEKETLDALQEVYERIQTVTGEDNLDLLVNKFIQAEDQNFALFNFVNEQNNESETLRDQINQIQKEMEQFQLEGLQQEQHYQSLLQDIDQKQKESESQAETNENESDSLSKILEEVKEGVNIIFSKIDCDRSVIEDKLGSSAGITENNIMSYLSLVEQKINQFLAIHAFLHSKDQEKRYSPADLAKFLLGQNPELLQQNLIIEPTVKSDLEELSLTDEEERPFSQEELRRKIKKAVLQTETTSSPGASKTS